MTSSVPERKESSYNIVCIVYYFHVTHTAICYAVQRNNVANSQPEFFYFLPSFRIEVNIAIDGHQRVTHLVFIQLNVPQFPNRANADLMAYLLSSLVLSIRVVHSWLILCGLPLWRFSGAATRNSLIGKPLVRIGRGLS